MAATDEYLCDNSLPMYEVVNSTNESENRSNTAQDKWPLIEYIQSLLEGKGADQKIEALRDVFDEYNTIPNTSGQSYYDVK